MMKMGQDGDMMSGRRSNTNVTGEPHGDVAHLFRKKTFPKTTICNQEHGHSLVQSVEFWTL